MPALYGITSNANVSVSNTTGLYIGSGNVTILNSAGTLLNLLSNAGTVGFYSTNSGTQVAASVDTSGVAAGTYGDVNNIPIVTVGSDGRVTQVTTANVSGQYNFYSNANVAAYLSSSTVTVGNLITTAGIYWANGQPYSSGTIYGNANVAAYLPGYTGVLGFGGGNKLTGSIFNFSIGANAPSSQGSQAIAIGDLAGAVSQGQNAIALGFNAGQTLQGQNAIAIGRFAGQIYQATNSIALIANSAITGAVGVPGPTISNSGLYVDPVRNDTGNVAQVLYYNTITKEITYTAPVSIYSNANVAAYLAANTDVTIQNLNANTQQQQIQINSTSANLASFETYANVTYQTIAGAYGNANVANYLPHYGGTLLANTISSNGATLNVSGPAIQMTGTNSVVVSSGNSGSVTMTGHQIFVSGVGGSDTLTVQVPQTNQSNLSMQSGYYINAERIIATGNIRTTASMISDNYLFANGVNILSTVSGTYSNSNVASYLAANTDPTISNLNANTSQQAAQIDSINANVGSFYTYANATYATNANLASTNANLAAFETYANVTFGPSGPSSYGNANVSSYLSSGSVNTINTTGNITTTANVVATGNFYGNLIAANILVANIGIQNYTSYGSVGAPTYAAGTLWYDSIQDSIAYYNSVLNNQVHVGQELQFSAYNGTGSQINQGVPVYLTGGSFNNLPNIAPAIANTISTSQVAGVANQNIPNNTTGCVVTVGVVANVAMGTFSVGDTLYLSPYSAGQVSNTQPPTGFVVKVGTVLYNNSPNGRFLVNKTVPVNNQYYGNLTLTGNLSANNASITNKITTGSLLSTGNITANTGSYFIGDGSQLTNLPTQSGTYSNTNVAAYLSGSITTGNITNTGTIVTTGNITAPNLLGTAQYFSGDLHGNVLYDSTKYRFFANAYPLSTPDNTKYANGFLTWIVPTPVYTAGVVQAPAAGSGLTTQGGQTLGAIMSANVYIAPAGGAGNRSTNGHMAYTQVMPTGNMAGVDRSRGLFSQLDVNLNGTTWGTMGSASQASLLLCASAGTTQLLGSGSAAHAVGFNSVVAVAPTNGNISVQYATGTYNFISLASNSAVNGTTIQYARLVSGSVAGQTANLSIVNMIGLHTSSGWATTGSINPTNRYAVLNEDAGTQIQTNGNINLVSTATTGLNSTGVFTATALNAITGVAGQFASVSNGTGKSGGAMAYWDTTNARWSWFDTNLAVS